MLTKLRCVKMIINIIMMRSQTSLKKGNDCNNEIKKKVGELIMVALPKWKGQNEIVKKKSSFDKGSNW